MEKEEAIIMKELALVLMKFATFKLMTEFIEVDEENKDDKEEEGEEVISIHCATCETDITYFPVKPCLLCKQKMCKDCWANEFGKCKKCNQNLENSLQ